MTSPAIKLARECGIGVGFDTTVASLEELERFYTKAQAQALRDAADWYDEKDRLGDESHSGQDELRRMADELERGA